MYVLGTGGGRCCRSGEGFPEEMRWELLPLCQALCWSTCTAGVCSLVKTQPIRYFRSKTFLDHTPDYCLAHHSSLFSLEHLLLPGTILFKDLVSFFSPVSPLLRTFPKTYVFEKCLHVNNLGYWSVTQLLCDWSVLVLCLEFGRTPHIGFLRVHFSILLILPSLYCVFLMGEPMAATHCLAIGMGM